ncbi:MAG: efflux RND transporter periplasmic adaptor subunit [Muribaculaceae bacterium]|nr:efflux RND transporter periplasmic adaptor subunit [Muribaculaceae bacterium]
MKKYLFLLLGVLAVASCSENKKVEQKAPIRVETLVVSPGVIDNAQTFVGIVEEREATAVSFTSMGVVKRILVKEGQLVRRGQLLAEIDATTSSNSVEVAHASLNQAKDMVKQAEATYNQAKDAYDRMKLLHDNGSLPEVKWIEAETRLAQATSALNTARSGVASATSTEKIARKGLADTRLYAPVSGVIGKKQLMAGETALPSQAVVNILDISTVKVKVAVPESEIGSINPGTSTSIKVDAIGRSYWGGKIEKGVQADALTHTYDVRINVVNGDLKLLPGMVANVRFVPKGAQGLGNKLIPVTSVQKKADGTLFVWTVDNNNTAHRTQVTTGKTHGNYVTVLTGVNNGQRIVTEGYQKLSEGTKVVF